MTAASSNSETARPPDPALRAPLHVAVCCGGTGGHMMPGLATGRVLKSRGHRVVVWLSGRGVEKLSAGGWDGEVVTVRSEGLPSGAPLKAARAALTLLRAWLTSFRHMKRDRPAVVLGMGGYSSVGPVLAARLLRVPVVLHEANVIPGRALDFLSRFAAAVAIAFPETAAHLPRARVVATGLPVREPQGLRFASGTLADGVFTVFITGGSQGAHALNEIGSEAICQLHRAGFPVQVIHITGAKDRAVVESRYNEGGVRHLVVDFLGEMEKAYTAADLAICRAGAGTCFELAAFGVPSLLVPLPTAARDHQTANAKAMQSSGASDVMAQKDFTASSLAACIRDLAGQPERRRAMGHAAVSRAQPAAADALADLVVQTGAGAPRQALSG